MREFFWTALGSYMALHHSSDGEKINWVNYKTGIKNIRFKMYAGTVKASIAIELTHPETESRRKYFEQFLQSKKLLRQFLNEDWNWQSDTTDENGKSIGAISKELQPANIYNNDDWPKIISFLKPRLIALDEFWNLAKYSFQNL